MVSLFLLLFFETLAATDIHTHVILVEPDPCHPNPCHHGVCAEINGGYVCNCSLGFRGPVCSGMLDFYLELSCRSFTMVKI